MSFYKYILLIILKSITIIFLFISATQASNVKNSATVFMYHKFGVSKYPSTSVTIDQLESHVEELIKEKYNILSLDFIIDTIINDGDLPDNTIGISIDDADKSPTPLDPCDGANIARVVAPAAAEPPLNVVVVLPDLNVKLLPPVPELDALSIKLPAERVPLTPTVLEAAVIFAAKLTTPVLPVAANEELPLKKKVVSTSDGTGVSDATKFIPDKNYDHFYFGQLRLSVKN